MTDVLAPLGALRDALISAKQTETSLQNAYDLAFAIGTALAFDRRTTETESDLASDILGQISSGLAQLRKGNQPILALARANTRALKIAFEKRTIRPQQCANVNLKMTQQLLLELPTTLPTARRKQFRRTVKEVR